MLDGLFVRKEPDEFIALEVTPTNLSDVYSTFSYYSGDNFVKIEDLTVGKVLVINTYDEVVDIWDSVEEFERTHVMKGED